MEENSRYSHSSFLSLVLSVSAALLASFVLVPSFLFFLSDLTPALTKGSGSVLLSNFKSGITEKLKLSCQVPFHDKPLLKFFTAIERTILSRCGWGHLLLMLPLFSMSSVAAGPCYKRCNVALF